MMGRGVIRAAGAAVLLSAGVPASATISDTATAAEDLDCAIWASAIAGSTNDKDVLLGIGPMLGYFLGRYEARTGTDIDDPMIARAREISQEDLAALDKACQPRMMRFGKRLVDIGNRMSTAAKTE